MHRHWTCVLIAAPFITLSLPGRAAADVLGTLFPIFRDQRIEPQPLSNDTAFGFRLGNLTDPGLPLVNPLFDFRLSLGNISSVFRVTAQDDPDFEAFAAALTNGVPERIGVEFYRLDASGQPVEPQTHSYLESTVSGKPDSDFAGNSITAITVAPTFLSVGSTLQIPGGGYLNTYQANLSVEIEGTPIPEPALALFAPASLLALVRRRSAGPIR